MGSAWRWRARYLLSGAWRRAYFRDYAGILLYQVSPGKIVEQVSIRTRMQFCLAVARVGRITSLATLSLFSAGPYHVFAKRPPHAGSQGPLPRL